MYDGLAGFTTSYTSAITIIYIVFVALFVLFKKGTILAEKQSIVCILSCSKDTQFFEIFMKVCKNKIMSENIRVTIL